MDCGPDYRECWFELLLVFAVVAMVIAMLLQGPWRRK
jgi:hypothetical protein